MVIYPPSKSCFGMFIYNLFKKEMATENKYGLYQHALKIVIISNHLLIRLLLFSPQKKT